MMLLGHPFLIKSNIKQSIEEASYKINSLIEVLQEIKSRREKALIFTPFLEMQSILITVIKHHFNLSAHCINGSTSQRSRQDILKIFKKSHGFNVIILSPRAAGLGLTITEANHVIHYHRMWNPAIENQATDRAYRIGQDKPVTVYYLIGTDPEITPTVDERVDALLAEKRKLMKDYLNPKIERKIRESDFADILGKERATIDIDCVDSLRWDEFEKLVSLLYQKKGYLKKKKLSLSTF